MSLKMEILMHEETLKSKLTPYREICPTLLDLFIWRQEIYPWIMVGLVTTFFGAFWYLEPSLITAAAVFCLGVTIMNNVAPFLTETVSKPEEWTLEKEKKFTIFVNRIAYYSIQVWNFHVTIQEWKQERPNMHSCCLIVLLLFVAWIGNAVNNLLLVYLLVLFLALMPGMLHRRILQSYFAKCVLFVTELLGIERRKNKVK